MDQKCTNLYFNIIKPIGNSEGKNSKVYIANDIQLNAKLIIKQVLKKDFIDKDNYFAEARSLYASRHPNVMEIQYASQDKDSIYFAMPYYKKGSLNSLINLKFLTIREIIKYSLDFLSGLHYVHSRNLIHFDIKPTNIIINDSDKALLTDFGLAKHMNSVGIAEQNYFYNLHKAPECLKTNKYSISVDIYQLGVTLYRMCNGNKFFKQQLDELGIKCIKDLNNAIIRGEFPNRKKYLPHIPSKLQKIINKSMEVDPIKRYQSVLDIINDISNIEENLDWVYNVSKDSEPIYYLKVGKFKHCIYILKSEGKFDILTKKVNMETSRENRVNNCCKTGYNTRNECLKEVAKIIKSYSI